MKHPHLACAVLTMRDAKKNPSIKRFRSLSSRIIVVIPYLESVGVACTKENLVQALTIQISHFNKVLNEMTKEDLLFFDNKRYYLTEKGKAVNKALNDRFFEYMDKL